jgi:hypothetical protein
MDHAVRVDRHVDKPRAFARCLGCILSILSGFLFVFVAQRLEAEQDHTLYVSGAFPPGRIYDESQIGELVDKTLANPSYLIGSFVFLGIRNGEHVFSTFSHGLLDTDDIAFGKILIAVKFFGNVPPGLDVGKVIGPTTADPLTIKSVRRSDDGFVLVATESWSTPNKQ